MSLPELPDVPTPYCQPSSQGQSIITGAEEAWDTGNQFVAMTQMEAHGLLLFRPRGRPNQGKYEHPVLEVKNMAR